jgi:hypothetical protein
MEYLVSLNMNIRNPGNKSTLVVCNRKEVLGLTQGTNKIGNLVCDWHESDQPSLSDHRYICFQIGNIAITRAASSGPTRITIQPEPLTHQGKYLDGIHS